MARNVLVLTLTGIGVFIGEVSQFSSYTKEVTVTEAISKSFSNFPFEQEFFRYGNVFKSPKNSRNKLRTYM